MAKEKPEVRKLAVEIRSTVKSEKIYGRRGDEVTVYMKKGDTAWIVEDKSGNRFTVNPENLM